MRDSPAYNQHAFPLSYLSRGFFSKRTYALLLKLRRVPLLVVFDNGRGDQNVVGLLLLFRQCLAQCIYFGAFFIAHSQLQ